MIKIMNILSNDVQVTAGSQAKIDLAVNLGADKGVGLIITFSSLHRHHHRRHHHHPGQLQGGGVQGRH